MNKFWFVHRLVTTLAQELSVKIFRCWIIMCIKKYVHVKILLGVLKNFERICKWRRRRNRDKLKHK